MSQETGNDGEVVGYELEMPWMQGVFGPISIMRWRICLKCYGATGGVRITSLTRQGVEAECAALCAQGITNFGGTDLCWTCGKNLLTGKRERDLRIIKPGEYLNIMPPVDQDADWHLTREAGAIWCPHCHDYRSRQESNAIMPS